MPRTPEPTPPPDLATTRRRLEECRRRLDRISARYGELEEALATLEMLADECFPPAGADPLMPQEPDDALRPRQPR